MRTRWIVLMAAAVVVTAQAAVAQEPEDNPRLRWEDFYQRRAYPLGRIPAGALQRGRAQAADLRSNALLAPPPISGTQWQSLGPTAIPYYGISTGRASAVAVHPTNSNTIYLGGAQGGVWKTVDGGVTWTPLTDHECSLAMGSIAIDPADPEVVYAGTGEQHFSGDSYYGCGVLRSTDGGGSWTRLGAGQFGSGRVARVVIAPRTAGTPALTTVFAASDRGLFRSTNGGATWISVLPGTTTDLVVHPTNDSVLYAAVWGRGVFKTTDRGTTWIELANGFAASSMGRINIALAPSAPETLYAAVANRSSNGMLGVWRTTNGGAAWTQLSASGASCGSQCWYDLYVAVHPTDPATVFLGGVDLYRSRDGGATFQYSGGITHADHHFMAFDPRDAATVYDVNDGGIYRSRDGGTTWSSLNQGLALTQFYEGISLHPSDQTIVLGGTQDNGTLQYGGQPTWQHVNCCDGGFTAIDRENPIVRYAETQWISGRIGGPHRSDGGGFVLKTNGISRDDPALFIPPLVMDPTTPSTLYFGTYRLYRTTNRGELWTTIMTNLTGGDGLSAIAPAPSNPSVIYVGASSSGLVFVSTDGGATWPLRSGLPGRFVEGIAVDRADAQTAYVVLSGFGGGHVFRTTNAGETWVDRSGNLPDVPVNAVVVDPASRAIVMVGTDLGVFASADSGATWTHLDQGMPNVAVIDIAYNPATATLIAATHGRGMFQLQLDRPLTLAVVPSARHDSALAGSAATHDDSTAVVLTGTGAAAAAWTATHSAAATWLTLGTSEGTYSGTLRWSRSPSGLAVGVYVDTIVVTVPGAIDSPSQLVDSLVVEPPPTLVVTPTIRSDTAVLGLATTRQDSVFVQLAGRGAAALPWTAAANQGVWITIATPEGNGPGQLRWTRSSAGRGAGVHVDTITVSAPGALGSPASVVDSLVVVVVAALFARPSTSDTMLAGMADVRTTSVQLLLAGGTDDTTAWTASHGAARWLSLQTASGRGSGMISWTSSAADLRDGVYRDTITVVTAAQDSARLVHVFVVQAPVVTADCAANHLLGATCLNATQMRWLDLAGNHDGQFNLGDLVAFLAGNVTAQAKGRATPR